MTYALWVVQGLLALLFLFTGGMKLVLPLEAMQGPVELPGLFFGGQLAPALLSVVVGLLAAFVAVGRWRLAPLRGSSRTATLNEAR